MPAGGAVAETQGQGQGSGGGFEAAGHSPADAGEVDGVGGFGGGHGGGGGYGADQGACAWSTCIGMLC